MMFRNNWSPRLAWGTWLQLLPLLVMFTVLWVAAWSPFNLSFNTIKFWEYLAYGWLYAAAVYLLGLICLVKYVRAWWLAVGFAWFYLLVYGVNACFLHHTGFMLPPYFFWVKNLSRGMVYVDDYFTEWVALLITAFVLCALLAAWLIWRCRRTLAQSHTRWLILVVALLYAAPYLREKGWFRPTYVAASVMHKSLQGAWRVDQTYSLRGLTQNPLVYLVRAAYVNRLQPMQEFPAGDLNAMSDIVKSWQLHLGARQYKPLGLQSLDHIIMFSTESLSLDFLSPYNTNLPPELTPFYASAFMTNRMFVDYQCVAAPTQPGLTATFNSHPNVGALLAGGTFDTSLIKLLDAHGYATYFLKSGPDTFLNDNVVYKEMGFQHVIGSQTWLKDRRYAPFVSERGLMDRALFRIAVDLLDQNRDKKVFIEVLSGDTHSPYPRVDFGPLQYPPTPDCVTQVTTDPQARAILTGIFRHDYDMGQTIQEIQDRGLLTSNTLVIVTADHVYPHGEALYQIPGYPRKLLSRIPLAFLSGQPLPPPDGFRQLHSQLDFAPTLVHLLGWPVPEGWWGDSMFDSTFNAPSILKLGRNLMVTPLQGPQQVVSLDHPNTPLEQGLVKLFSSVYTNALPAVSAISEVTRANAP